jgi:hydantoinase/oxoprolinase-like protein
MDPVTFTVIMNRLNSIAEEMTVTLERAAMTSVLALSRDYGTYTGVGWLDSVGGVRDRRGQAAPLSRASPRPTGRGRIGRQF